MVILNFEDLTSVRKSLKQNVIVFCSGSFDLVHLGHILFFEDCKALGDTLVVSVADDFSISTLKGTNRPILNQHIRVRTIDSLKPVDYTLINSVCEDDIFCDLKKILNALTPDFYVINKDAFDIEERREICKKSNIELIILDRYCPTEFENISTSSIIKKVLSTQSI